MQSIHSDKESLLTIGEAAKVGQLSVSTLRRYEKQGLITPLRTPGNQRRYRESDVRNLLRPPASVGGAPSQGTSSALTASEFTGRG